MLRARVAAAVLAACVVPLAPLPAAAAAARADGPLLVVVSADSGPGAKAVGRTGARLVRRVPALHATVVRVPSGDLRAVTARLAARPGVRYVEPLVRRTALSDADTPERAELGVAEAAALVPASDGRGSVVAVLDTGVDATNPDLVGRVTDGGDFTGSLDGGSRGPGGDTDGNGHGTGVAALAAAAADGSGMVGTAPAAVVRSYKVLDADGAGGSLGLAAAIRAVADDAAAGLDVSVANMSLGGPFRSQIETDALGYAARVAPQVLFVAAAGNDGGNRPSFPAAFPGVLSVGATARDADGVYRRAAFSTTADVDVLAPGVDVLTYDYVPGRTPPALGQVSGTSEAAPAVSGLVAGLASGRGVRGQQAATLLKASAEPAQGRPLDDAGDGSGRADALAAVALGDGTRGYSTVFADGGAHVEADATRALSVQRFAPAGSATSPATLTTSSGALAAGPVASLPVTGGTLVSQRFGFRLPGEQPGAWSAAGPDGEVGDAVPFLPLALAGGEHGQPVRSGEQVQASLGGGDGTAALVSFSVQRDELFTVTGSAPADGGPLYLWAPDDAGGSASSYDEPAEEIELVAGSATYRAPRTGRYVVGHLLASDDLPRGAYAVRVDAPEPTGRVQADDVSSASTGGLPFRVAWQGAREYDVQWTVRTRTSAGWQSAPWRTWLADTAATSALFGAGGVPVSVAPGATYAVRVVPHDGLGGVGEPSVPAVVTVPYDDRASDLRWSSGWSTPSAPDRWRGTLHTTELAGSSALLTTEASELAVVADRGPTLGQFDVLVDGVRRARVDLGARAAQRRVVVWRSGSLGAAARSHTLRLVAVGTPGRPRVSVDAVAVRR